MNQFDFKPRRLVYLQAPAEGPGEQDGKFEAPKEDPNDARKEVARKEIKDKYADEYLERRNMTAEEGREILSDPEKLQSFLDYFSKPMEGGHIRGFSIAGDEIQNLGNTYIIGEMLDVVNPDTAFLKQIIETYMDVGTVESGDSHYIYNWLCSRAIQKIDLVDDEFFKGVFEKSKDHDVKVIALGKIQDQAYVASVEDKYRPNRPNTRHPNKGTSSYDPTASIPHNTVGGHKSTHR